MHICQEEILPIIVYCGPIATMLWLTFRARVRSALRRWLGRPEHEHSHCNHEHHDDSKPS